MFVFKLKFSINSFFISFQSALLVAMLNIWIPQGVGDVINVLTKVSQVADKSDEAKSIFFQLAVPAYNLGKMYLAQAFFTFIYIYTLSHVGEAVASELRKDLFKSIMMQDIAFFDENRTGEIMNRLTSDVQDFKSAFKTCISQGLRSLTQILGCVISVIVISPQLTGAMVLSLPSIIFVGSFIGKSLRKLSNMAQNQIAKSTAVGEEAIQNVRTVRATKRLFVKLKLI